VGHDTDVAIKVQVDLSLRGRRGYFLVNILSLRANKNIKRSLSRGSNTLEGL
jgi:hypothetical protein